MLVQTQTTIRILIVAAAGVATVALARPASDTQAGVPNVSLSALSVEPRHVAPTRLRPRGSKYEATTGFAVFCEDRR